MCDKRWLEVKAVFLYFFEYEGGEQGGAGEGRGRGLGIERTTVLMSQVKKGVKIKRIKKQRWIEMWTKEKNIHIKITWLLGCYQAF